MSDPNTQSLPVFNFHHAASKALGWSLREVTSMSARSLREALTQNGHKEIADEITRLDRSGALLLQPIPAKEAMAWLYAPKAGKRTSRID